ncbi:MAG: NifU family protein [Proteobacteria bacterium]|nr:NifU family protein [Pseudomonadota bacterium]
MFITTKHTPNPNSLKFIPGIPVYSEGTLSFKEGDDMSLSPLVESLMDISGVVSIMLGDDFITVTKSQEANWDILKTLVIAAIVDHIATGDAIILKAKLNKETSNKIYDEDSTINKIKALIDEKVRPAVAQDGGDITFHDFEDGVVYLEMHGACSGCPSSLLTLKSGVENMLQYYIPEVKEVRSIN